MSTDYVPMGHAPDTGVTTDRQKYNESVSLLPGVAYKQLWDLMFSPSSLTVYFTGVDTPALTWYSAVAEAKERRAADRLRADEQGRWTTRKNTAMIGRERPTGGDTL